MDYELIFWCILGAIALVGLLFGLLTPDCDKPVSEYTLRRLRGERTH
jgi:hypothetical protein